MAQNTDPDFARLLRQSRDMRPFPSAEASRPIWIFGGGRFGQDVCAALQDTGFEVRGFIETTPRKNRLRGLPVKRWDELTPDDRTASLAIGIHNRDVPLDSLERTARAAGFTDILMPWHLHAQFEHQLGWRYWLGKPELITSRVAELEQAHGLLTDAQSRQCLLDICRFRLGMHTPYGHFRHDTRQYFNALTLNSRTPSPIRYVDGGAYNGDTFFEFASLHPIAKAYLFEPDPENFAKLQANIHGSKVHVQTLPLALSDRYQILSFSAGWGEAGTINPQGTAHIAAMALDEFLPTQCVDFIKLDVEGSEIVALNGAARLIERCRPTLAISAYHKPQDLWEIPLWLQTHCPDYEFALRQHHCNSFDSVFYAVPRAR